MKNWLLPLFPHLIGIGLFALALRYSNQHFEWESPQLLWLALTMLVHAFLRARKQQPKGFNGMKWSWGGDPNQINWKNRLHQLLPEIPYAIKTLAIGLLALLLLVLNLPPQWRTSREKASILFSALTSRLRC